MKKETPAADAFYNHKREAHNGDYSAGCPECAAKWEALKAEAAANVSYASA